MDWEYLWNPDAPMRKWLSPKLRGSGGGSDTTAQDLYAQMTRRGWYDYLNTLGVPQEDKLIDYATNPKTVTDAMSGASTDVNAAFDRQGLATARRLQSLGLTLSADEQAAADRSTNLARVTADVGAQNRARDLTIARQQSILGNPAPQLGVQR